jgi:hypothetical protein
MHDYYLCKPDRRRSRNQADLGIRNICESAHTPLCGCIIAAIPDAEANYRDPMLLACAKAELRACYLWQCA